MRYEVLLTAGAERDLEEIYDYIAEFDSPDKADLAAFPGRGSHPRELQDLGIREYRQTFFKPYRVIYRVFEKQVFIYLIADGRRDMQSLLSRRLLGA